MPGCGAHFPQGVGLFEHRWATSPEASQAKPNHDPERAPLVAWAFKEVARGVPRRHVLNELHRKGLRTLPGKRLSDQSFGLLLASPAYMGRIKAPKAGVSTVGDWKPIIDEKTFYRAA